MWRRNCLPIRSTWVHPCFWWGSCCSIFSFLRYRSLYVLLSRFFWPLCCLSVFDQRLMITPLISSNFSKPFSTGRPVFTFSQRFSNWETHTQLHHCFISNILSWKQIARLCCHIFPDESLLNKFYIGSLKLLLSIQSIYLMYISLYMSKSVYINKFIFRGNVLVYIPDDRYLTLVQISSQDVYNYPNQKYV